MQTDLHSDENHELAIGQLDTVLQSRNRIADSIDELAMELPSHRRQFTRRLSERFRSSLTPQSVLTDSSALTICLPLMQHVSAEGTQLSDPQISDAVGRALLVPVMPVPPGRRLRNSLVYPLLILLGCVLLIIGFCLFLVPQFEEMFDEFGLQLPIATQALVSLSHFVRGWLFLPLVAIGVTGSIALVFAIRHRAPGGFLEGLMTNKRIACGTWSWHVALLLELGFSQADAIATAGSGSCKRWLDKVSQQWSRAAQDGQKPLNGVGRVHGQPMHLVSLAFALPNVGDQTAALKETAVMYWERGATASRWRWGWLPPLAILLVMCLIGFIVAALFMPMVQLISGLT